MKIKQFLILVAALTLCACASHKHKHLPPFNTKVYLYGIVIHTDTFTLFNPANNRSIPVKIYYRDEMRNIHDPIAGTPIIFNTGYGATRNDYDYLADKLAEDARYMVIVIQHDLPTDTPISATTDSYALRNLLFDRGVKNIYYVVEQLKNKFPKLSYNKLILMGHSFGGDMAMLIANENPKYAKTVITLDNCHIPCPRSSEPHIFSIRSNDKPADDGGLPNEEGQEKYDIKIVKANVTHNDMTSPRTDKQRKEIDSLVTDYLKSN